MLYRNATFAFVGELEQIVRSGSPVTVRDEATHELLARTVSLAHPQERFITVPGRLNDVIATVAETMWVLGGRDDIEFLQRYLKRAPNYSDNGKVWRGGYGPRLRAWNGVDQISEIRALLERDPLSRRAVAVLYDPARDFDPTTRDVPCNNWLHFIHREGRLDLDIVIRSNDILWGFSGINTFEWSVLHEAMAHWLGLRVGTATFFISSLHLYDEREQQALQCLKGFAGRSGYEQGWSGSQFATAWEDFDTVIAHWFALESRVANGEHVSDEIEAFPDPLLRDFLQAVAIKWARAGGADEARLRAMVDALGRTDLAFALHEQLFGDSGQLIANILTLIDGEEIKRTIEALHRSKDASYGNSWKRRGEQVSILANIARKADRIENVVGGAPTGPEGLIDTAADLFVYSLKYELFLADQDAALATELLGETGTNFSDGPEGFARLIGDRDFGVDCDAVDDEAAAAVAAFDRLDRLVREGSPTISEKATAARALTDVAVRLVLAVAKSTPDALIRLQSEIG